jgi:hypothetical protein
MASTRAVFYTAASFFCRPAWVVAAFSIVAVLGMGPGCHPAEPGRSPGDCTAADSLEWRIDGVRALPLHEGLPGTRINSRALYSIHPRGNWAFDLESARYFLQLSNPIPVIGERRYESLSRAGMRAAYGRAGTVFPLRSALIEIAFEDRDAGMQLIGPPTGGEGLRPVISGTYHIRIQSRPTPAGHSCDVAEILVEARLHTTPVTRLLYLRATTGF